MVLSKYSPAERLVRKRLAARLRQQRCRARKRATSAPEKDLEGIPNEGSMPPQQEAPHDSYHGPSHATESNGRQIVVLSPPSHHHHHHHHIHQHPTNTATAASSSRYAPHPPQSLVRPPSFDRPPAPYHHQQSHQHVIHRSYSREGPPTSYGREGPPNSYSRDYYASSAPPPPPMHPPHHHHYATAPPSYHHEAPQTIVVPSGTRVVLHHAPPARHAAPAPYGGQPQHPPSPPHHYYAPPHSYSAAVHPSSQRSYPVSRTISRDESTASHCEPGSPSSPATYRAHKRALEASPGIAVAKKVKQEPQDTPKTALWNKEKAAIAAMLTLGSKKEDEAAVATSQAPPSKGLLTRMVARCHSPNPAAVAPYRPTTSSGFQQPIRSVRA